MTTWPVSQQIIGGIAVVDVLQLFVFFLVFRHLATSTKFNVKIIEDIITFSIVCIFQTFQNI